MSKSLKLAIAAAAFASSQAFAADVTAPFEVTQFDRILPNVTVMAAGAASASKAGAPFEVTEFDRILPDVLVNTPSAGQPRAGWNDRIPDPYVL